MLGSKSPVPQEQYPPGLALVFCLGHELVSARRRRHTVVNNGEKPPREEESASTDNHPRSIWRSFAIILFDTLSVFDEAPTCRATKSRKDGKERGCTLTRT
ncbi:hypothetical protein DPEC_G00023730 [Dallia pectoralis]|uniref:Uncharacterized protein n=1 Tax=Dallia pectoralis TaxID=75939 RepID=A0ACC2HGT2_DALPE|nr:hypothetical protein DPEC_G00023730 [Dallia pectoralis]